MIGIGMNTVYPSMVLFAKYAMLVMSFAHIYVITYFIANLVLKEDRIRKRKHDGLHRGHDGRKRKHDGFHRRHDGRNRKHDRHDGQSRQHDGCKRKHDSRQHERD